ncbi:clathrin heavy chain linker domain-containing protein 1 [Varanus komodoensis]|uniref:clathrin heavy chain linker domain-containing protein 1 n=1 Tax=Varanus komodoensis TaxID=61221 RepID=UPI001CF7B60D|nr:clathrin heavy chain linker domain-containing protein 1 [Varanus komodoensis]XP_044285526.1 clathrin heavy chain linker domain-containing protein 1 [Varanus komodoensis]XP_044285527.1 clathrin heavy chain linker domain-containing protein 1 [Varanus komodoensis]
MKAASIGASSRPVLPPIIPETEKEFLESIQDYIISEIEKVGCTEQGPAEEYYIIYRNVFEKIIEHVNTYKGILTTIKQEYDAFIEAIKKGQRNAFYLHGKLKVLACEPSTLMYYKKRITQLEEKIKRIERNSARIENLIQKIRTLRLTIAADGSQNPTKKVNPAQKIPGLNLKDSFDISALSSHLAHLQQRTKELKEDMLTKYIPLENTVSVEKDMKRALHLRNVAEKENESLKFCYYRLTQFANVVNIWENSDRSIDTLQQLIFQMIENEKLSEGTIVSSISSVFERDPSKRKEAEDLIEYIERFNELFSRGQYEAAAIYAANCPRGILCNEEALEKFRAVGPIKGKTLPLLMYCEALVSTAIAVEQPLPTNLTTEAIKCALSEKRLDLVMHWVTLHRLEFSEAAGDAIYKYAEVDKHNKSQCLALAQIVYGECGAHRKAALCLCKQGQIFGAMDYLHQCKPLPTGDYIFLIKHCPTVELIRRLTQEWNGQPALMSLGETVLSFIHTEYRSYCLRLLEELANQGKDVLERMIVNDSVCSVEGWKDIAETCLQTRREKLARLLISVLAAQEGVVELPLDDHEDAKLMEHIFM